MVFDFWSPLFINNNEVNTLRPYSHDKQLNLVLSSGRDLHFQPHWQENKFYLFWKLAVSFRAMEIS
jgi:hypothetical protein